MNIDSRFKRHGKKGITYFYDNGTKLEEGDKVLVDDTITGTVDKILLPGTKDAEDSQHSLDGGIILSLDNGDVQVWPEPDEDLVFIARKQG